MKNKTQWCGRNPFPPRHKPEKITILKVPTFYSWQECLVDFIWVLMMGWVLVWFFKIIIYLWENGNL